ncbi:MAG: hypothetical protein IH873_03700 [Chloroflexi bacterium]|nr:hypothetical protein [Chloroflexota bacterium]
MVLKESLNKEIIEAGNALIERLKERGQDIPAAVWMYLPEPRLWRLFLATPLVKSKGPRAAYDAVLAVLADHKEELPVLDLQDVTVVSPDDSVLEPFRTALDKSEGPGIRLRHNTIAGKYIEDAYVYRLV